MAQEEAMAEIEKGLSEFRYAGEILSSIKNQDLQSVGDLISYYLKLWEITEGLTDEYLRRKEDESVEVNPGGQNSLSVRGKKIRFNIDAVIESLRNQETYIEEILSELRRKFPRRFPRNSKFLQMGGPKP